MDTTGLARFLREFVGVLGALLFLGGVLLTVAGGGFGGVMLMLPGGILLAVALYEVMRYRGETDEPGPGAPAGGAGPPSRYERTGEVFEDPTTGQRLRVWHDSRTGERRYIPEP